MAHMMMDGGGSGGASGDGLIDPSQFPCRSADFSQDRILASAAAVSGIGDNVFAAVENTQTAWNGLQSPGVYEAPEQDAVYTLIQPAVDEAQTFRDGLGRVSQALSTYADELAAIQPALRDLEERAAAFRAEALAGYEVNNYEAHGWFAYFGWADMGPLAQAESQGTALDPMGKTTIGWREHGPARDKNEELLTEHGEILERVSTAAANCANTINAELNMCVAPVVPFDAEVFLQTDDPMPFGAPMEEDRNCTESVGHGFQTFVGDTIHGIVGLVGFDENWQHSWEYAGQNWANTGDFLLSTLIMLNPQLWLGSMGNQMLGHGTEYDAWIMERLNLGFGGWSSLIGYDHFAALEGENGWHRWEEDGWATLTESGLGLGTMFLGGSGFARGVRNEVVTGSV
ncbi:hypothetical protein N8K70_15140 [Microbacterium betulae]|uniref:Uncharacterized protein n=1 Tax=Microbacterium betulae TaxID=2981139 RepID=A0AA97I6S7_9MICO|nr:hypothetical protein [Microbacterium sp. AB]WOF22710.1 hypothetical protein N8K70_15140 [Microbacterium sp. AB]